LVKIDSKVCAISLDYEKIYLCLWLIGWPHGQNWAGQSRIRVCLSSVQIRLDSGRVLSRFPRNCKLVEQIL
jgi:hypothetical protein